ncbi:hypothetical protein ABZY31_23725 [Streptomyces sp. NPDC006529]|uniref:hypothetical protein n=1 Tax=Streptomyces sp. NPDC006529 TaxID=3157177 RepID=UPI0033BF9632
MIWWLRSRSVTVLTACTLLTALAGLVIGNIELPVPVLTGQAGHFVLAQLVTVLPAVMWLSGTGRAGSPVEATAVRPVHRWDTALAAALTAVVLAISAAAHLAGNSAGSGIAASVGRNTAVYFGIALILNPLVGHRVAAPLTAAFPLLCAAAGRRTTGGAEPWALVLHEPHSVPALAATGAALALGCSLSALRPPGTVLPPRLTPWR